MRPFILLAAASVLAPAQALASPPVRDVLELTLGGGAYVPAKDHELYDRKLGRREPFDPLGPAVSIGAAYYPFSWLGVGAEASFTPISTLEGHSADLLRVRGHAIAQLPWIVTPYVLAGGGAIGVSSGDEALGSDMDPALHWGAGVKLPGIGPFSFHLDARHIISAREGASAGNTSHFEALAGISIALLRTDPGQRIREETPFTPAPVPLVATPPIVKLPEPAPVLVSRSPVMKVEDTVAAIQGELDRVHFAWGSARLEERSFPHLNRIAELLDDHLEVSVEIFGHTDSTGPRRFNMELSMRRAAAVKVYLQRRGIAAERLSIDGYGPTRPVATNKTSTGRAENRRSEIRVRTYDEDERADLGN